MGKPFGRVGKPPGFGWVAFSVCAYISAASVELAHARTAQLMRQAVDFRALLARLSDRDLSALQRMLGVSAGALEELRNFATLERMARLKQSKGPTIHKAGRWN